MSLRFSPNLDFCYMADDDRDGRSPLWTQSLLFFCRCPLTLAKCKADRLLSLGKGTLLLISWVPCGLANHGPGRLGRKNSRCGEDGMPLRETRESDGSSRVENYKSKRLQGRWVAVHFQGLVKSDWVGGGARLRHMSTCGEVGKKRRTGQVERVSEMRRGFTTG